MMKGVEDSEEFFKMAKGENNMIVGEEQIVKEYGSSLNALAKSYAHNTIRIKRSCQKRNMIILRLCFAGKLFPFGKWFSWKVNSWKTNYFPMFGSVMENELENIFQCLVMLWKMNWKIIY